jgi:hypothetical protein
MEPTPKVAYKNIKPELECLPVLCCHQEFSNKPFDKYFAGSSLPVFSIIYFFKPGIDLSLDFHVSI